MGLARFGIQFPFPVPSSLSDVIELSASLCESLCTVDVSETLLLIVDTLNSPYFETSKLTMGGGFTDVQLSCPLFRSNRKKPRGCISPA